MKEFADGLVENKNKVTIVTPFDTEFRRKGDSFKITTYKYIWPDSLHAVGYSKTMDADISLKKKAYFLLPFMLFLGTIKLYKTVKKEKADLINVHWILPNGVMALVVSKLTGVPFVITLPGTDAFLAYKNKAFGLVAKIIAQNSSGIVSNSSLHLKRILSLGISKRKKTAVISYPADVSALKPIKNKAILSKYRRKHNLKEKDFLVLAVGRLVHKKGFKYAIKAMPQILKKNKDVHLAIAGDGDLMSHLNNLAKKLKVDKNVTFLGTVARDEMLICYNMADCLIAPSIIDKNGNVDGGPLVTLESMACGKPQILTNILGMASEMENKKNGFIIPQKNSKEIAKAVLKLSSDKSLCKKMGKENQKLATGLSTKNIGKRYTAFFNKVLSG